MANTLTDDNLARALKVLGHPARIKLFRLLGEPKRFPGNLVDPVRVGVCVNDLAKEAGLPQSTTSHHLGLLQEVGLVETTEHGQWRYIRPNAKALQQLGTMIAALAP